MHQKDIVMRKIYLLTIGIAALIASGCGDPKEVTSSNENGDNNQLFKEVMEVHDVAMARMGELHNIKKELKKEMSSADSTSRLFDSLTTLVNKLEFAAEGKFDWMGKFKDPRGTLPSKDAKAYLEDQLIKVN